MALTALESLLAHRRRAAGGDAASSLRRTCTLLKYVSAGAAVGAQSQMEGNLAVDMGYARRAGAVLQSGDWLRHYAPLV